MLSLLILNIGDSNIGRKEKKGGGREIDCPFVKMFFVFGILMY